MCLCSCLHSQGQLSLSLKSSLTVKTCCMYLTRSASLSRDFPSLRLAWKGHHRIWLWESMFPHSEHFHSCFVYNLLLHWFIFTSVMEILTRNIVLASVRDIVLMYSLTSKVSPHMGPSFSLEYFFILVFKSATNFD